MEESRRAVRAALNEINFLAGLKNFLINLMRRERHYLKAWNILIEKKLYR